MTILHTALFDRLMPSCPSSDAPPPRLDAFLMSNRLPTPLLVVDLEMVVDQYRRLGRAFPGALIYYAVKANPLPEILSAGAYTYTYASVGFNGFAPLGAMCV